MKRFWTLILALALCLSLLAGCGGGGSGGEATDGPKDTLTVVVNTDPGTLDPHDNVNFAPHQIKRQIYETLDRKSVV